MSQNAHDLLRVSGYGATKSKSFLDFATVNRNYIYNEKVVFVLAETQKGYWHTKSTWSSHRQETSQIRRSLPHTSKHLWIHRGEREQ